MTEDEKMDTIDTLSNATRNTSAISTIEWHREMLKQKAENLQNGTDGFISLEEAESRIREKTGRAATN